MSEQDSNLIRSFVINWATVIGKLVGFMALAALALVTTSTLLILPLIAMEYFGYGSLRVLGGSGLPMWAPILQIGWMVFLVTVVAAVGKTENQVRKSRLES